MWHDPDAVQCDDETACRSYTPDSWMQIPARTLRDR